MQNRLKLIGIALTITTGAVLTAAPTDGQPQQQSLLSRLRQRNNPTQQQVAPEPAQVAQARGYQPGVTFPQQQQQQQPQQQQPATQPQQPGYPAYPPRQAAPVQGQQPAPYNMQQPQRTPAAASATATPRSQQSSQRTSRNDESADTAKESRSDSSSSRSRSSNSSSDNEKKSSARTNSSDSDSKKASSDDSEKKSSASDSNKSGDSSSKKSSSAESPSALQKIARKVESDDSDADKPKKAEKTPEPKKSEDEIAREKAHAAFLKAADEATTVVAGFLKQANDGYYSKASESLSPAIQKYFTSEISAVNGTEKVVLDELTANGTITMVTYINTTVRGEGAVVEAELGYADGHTSQRSIDLIKIDGKWKIVLPVKGIMSDSNASATSAAKKVSAGAMAAAAAANNAASVNGAAPTGVQATPAANPGSLPVTADATAVPLTPEQAAARAAAPLVMAPDAATTAGK